jgi:hypothetical protein
VADIIAILPARPQSAGAKIRVATAATGMARTVEYRHGSARPSHPLTHMSELTDGPVKPGHDEKRAGP